jgi:hypothetical protein
MTKSRIGPCPTALDHSRQPVLDAQGKLLSRYVNHTRLGAERAAQHRGSWSYPVLDFQHTSVANTPADGSSATPQHYSSFGEGIDAALLHWL